MRDSRCLSHRVSQGTSEDGLESEESYERAMPALRVGCIPAAMTPARAPAATLAQVMAHREGTGFSEVHAISPNSYSALTSRIRRAIKRRAHPACWMICHWVEAERNRPSAVHRLPAVSHRLPHR